MTTTTLPLTEARNRFSELVESASSLYQRFSITLRGKPAAVLMSQDEYEDIMETLDILADKNLIRSIKTAEKQAEQGKIISLKQLTSQLNVSI